jgi:ATP-dependent DNA ligase
VVCGFTEGKGNRKHFGALLLGAYRNRRRRYFDYSGTGFSEKGLKEAIDRLKPIFIDESPASTGDQAGIIPCSGLCELHLSIIGDRWRHALRRRLQDALWIYQHRAVEIRIIAGKH